MSFAYMLTLDKATGEKLEALAHKVTAARARKLNELQDQLRRAADLNDLAKAKKIGEEIRLVTRVVHVPAVVRSLLREVLSKDIDVAKLEAAMRADKVVRGRRDESEPA